MKNIIGDMMMEDMQARRSREELVRLGAEDRRPRA